MDAKREVELAIIDEAHNLSLIRMLSMLQSPGASAEAGKRAMDRMDALLSKLHEFPDEEPDHAR